MSLREKILEQAKTPDAIQAEIDSMRARMRMLADWTVKGALVEAVEREWVPKDVVCGLLDKAITEIKQKTVNILNQVNIETGLTVIEKGNIKRFLSYYTADVLVVLGGENQK